MTGTIWHSLFISLVGQLWDSAQAKEPTVSLCWGVVGCLVLGGWCH